MDIDLAMLPFSFLAGVATFFNPCFGALLPAYASLYFARDEADSASWWLRGMHGLIVGGVISAGFLTSLGGLGLVFALIGTAIARYIPWVAVLVGVLMVITGAVLLARPTLSLSLGAVAGRWVPLTVEGKGELLPFYVYGASYAICAAACTLPIFLAVMVQTFTKGVANGLFHFAAYGWGMSTMMLLFAVALAYSKEIIYRFVRFLRPWMHSIGGAFMILAGGYVLYYLLIYGRYLDDLLRR